MTLARFPAFVSRWFLFVIFWSSGLLPTASAQPAFPGLDTGPSGSKAPLNLTADRLEFDQTSETYIARGSVLLVQGFLRMTADEATLHKLSGKLLAKGRVHLRDQVADVWSEELELNVNTEAGVILNGTLHNSQTNTWVRGRLLERFSETHYRVRDGMFTNCDADDGNIPDWSFTFKDIDLEQNDSVYARGVWFRVKDYRILPLPALRYPMPGVRKTGFLFPTVGIDNVFGFQYRQGFYWAISPSQDLTLTPQILTKRGQGGDVEYRYILDRQSRGNWLLSTLRDTDVDRTRMQITGAHVQQFTKDLLLRTQVNYATDRSLLSDLSNSGVFRALPSQESILTLNQRLSHGQAYLTAQYLQPLDSGGKTTFQRLPEIGHVYASGPLGYGPLSVNMNSNFVHYYREEGFNVSRVDLLPGIAVDGLHAGHVLGFRPQFKAREVIYTHGRDNDQNEFVTRETFWAGLETTTNLSRRFNLGDGRNLRHTLAPKLFYEFVPPTKQSDIVQVDAVDDLPKKHLLTYSLNTALREESGGQSRTWLDLLLAQSYHLGSAPGQASIFSNIWGRATIGFPAQHIPGISNVSLTLDSFYDPGQSEFSQFNSDVGIQANQTWYMTVGHRYTRSGVAPRRGDIWNPVSFNEVLAPQAKINFVTAGGGVRLPFGWTVGTRVYHDFTTGVTSEWDVVGLYQNPCRCWSLGLYYIKLASSESVAERNQFNFVLTLRGIGATPGFGTQIVRSLLEPLLGKEPGLPWSPR